MELIEWCSFCNATPADGTVTLEDKDTKERIPLPACLPCVNKLEWSKK